MSGRTVRKYSIDDQIIYTDNNNEQYLGAVTGHEKTKGDGVDFYVYYVDLMAKKVKKDDTSAETTWETIKLVMHNPVSDYCLRPIA